MIQLNNDLSGFVDRLIEEKGMESLDADVLAQVKEDLSSRIEDQVNASILASMPPEKLEEFDLLLDQDNEQLIQEFCSKNIPDLDQLLAKTLLDFRSTYLLL